MCEKNRAREHIKNKYEPLTKNEKQKQKYRKNMTDEQKQMTKIIKNNVEKIRPMSKNKK